MVWEGKGFAPKKDSNPTQPKITEVQLEQPPHQLGDFPPASLNKESMSFPFRQERSNQIEKSLQSLLSKIYLKFGGEDSTFDHDDGVNNSHFLEDVDADGALGYRFKLESQGFCAVPVIGYLLNIHFFTKKDQKISSEFPFSQMFHWKGPYIGFNAAMHFLRFLSVDAAYSFHLVDFHHLFYDEILPQGYAENQKIAILRHYSNIGLGHTGLLEVSLALGTKWKLGINCKYKQFGTIESSDTFHTQWKSFQTTGELGVKF